MTRALSLIVAGHTSARLAEEVAAARQTETECRAEVDRLSAFKVSLLDADDGAQAKNRAALQDARDRVEQASLYVEELTSRLRAAEAGEAEQRRLDAWNAATKQADAAAKLLAKNYPRICTDALALVRTLAEAQVAVDAVNNDLPAGALPILDPEVVARGVPGAGREVISEVETERWTRLDQTEPVPDAFVHEIYDVGGGWGKRAGDVEAGFLKARFLRVEYRDAVPALAPLPLASYLRLPALRGDGVAWGHHQTITYDPAVAALVAGTDAPDHIVERIGNIDLAPAKPLPLPRATKVEWRLLAYVDATGIPVNESDAYSTGRAAAASQPVQKTASKRR